MNLDDQALEVLSELACRAALTAGAFIRDHASLDVEVYRKEGATSLAAEVVTEIDFKSQALIIETLQPSLERYDLALLSEEQEDTLERLEKDYFWCIDPLDGTLAFTERKPGFAVSIALVSKTGEPMIGVVYDPSSDTLYSAIKGKGAKRNREPWSVLTKTGTKKGAKTGTVLTLPVDRSLTALAGFSRFIEKLESWALANGLEGVELVQHAGAVINACKVLEHPPACYFKPTKAKQGGGSIWDFAATACLFNELGKRATNFAGEPLELNSPTSTFMNHQGVMYTSDGFLAEVIRQISEFEN